MVMVPSSTTSVSAAISAIRSAIATFGVELVTVFVLDGLFDLRKQAFRTGRRTTCLCRTVEGHWVQKRRWVTEPALDKVIVQLSLPHEFEIALSSLLDLLCAGLLFLTIGKLDAVVLARVCS